MTAEGLIVEGGGRVVVDGLDLHARSGRVVGVAGPSGSGKTTVLYALAGLIPAAAGRLLVDGLPIVPWREASVGVIFQNLCLVPLLSAQETVALPLQAEGLARDVVAERSAAALAALGLADHGAQLIGDLSGGQRQRVAVARSLAAQHDVVLADEPTSALDPHWRQVVLEMLAREARRGAIVVVASSDAEVMSICDDVVRLGAGPSW